MDTNTGEDMEHWTSTGVEPKDYDDDDDFRITGNFMKLE